MTIHDEHIQLIVRYLAGDLTDSERLLLEGWVDMSDENRAEFLAYKNTWNLTGYASGKGFNTSNSWKKLSNTIACIEDVPSEKKAVVPAKSNKLKSIGYYLARVAAVLVFAFGSYFIFNQTQQPELMTASAEGLSGQGVKLADGSIVSLNSNASITYPEEFIGNERLVSLTGEAFFEVAHNPEMPLVIEMGNLRVKVLGTTFDLDDHSNCNNIVLYLQTGKVLFYSIDPIDESVVEQIVLTPGQKGIYNKQTGEITQGQFDSKNFMAWKSGVLEFNHTPLAQVFKVLEKTYNVRVKNGSAYNDLLLTAKYDNESLESVFESLNVIFDIKFCIQGKQITLQ